MAISILLILLILAAMQPFWRGAQSGERGFVELPATVSGRLIQPGQVAAFRFAAAKGKPVQLTVQSFQLGFPLDPVLRVLDAAGKQLAESDDAGRQRAGLEPRYYRPVADVPITEA